MREWPARRKTTLAPVMDPMDASAVRGKITLVRFCSNLQLPGSDEELTAVTFCIMDEDHTMGNALRYMLMKEYVHHPGPDDSTFRSRDATPSWGHNIGILRL